jgi:RimJ/RimL family protein N-acetyltransferase
LAVQPTTADLGRSAGQETEWRRGLPRLTDGVVVLRELRGGDARSLLRHLNDPIVLQYVAPCPSTVEGFSRFIRWTRVERRRARHACYGIVPAGDTAPVGIIQLWPIERDFSVAEWGFVLARPHWSTNLFVRSACLFLDAVFVDSLFGAVSRLEARAVDANARGNGVLRKLGATPEGVLRAGFIRRGVVADHVMWSMLGSEWRARRRSIRQAN